MPQQGKLLAAMGLPGSGKSTLFGRIGEISNCAVFREPEENEWPTAVSERDNVGHITALTWFRSMRVPMLYKASEIRNGGNIALVDSYYDKLVIEYLGHPCVQWLISPSDHYFQIAQNLASLDRQHLPEADCVVCVTVERKKWEEKVKGRNRTLDNRANLIDTFESQELFLKASEKYCSESGATLIVYQNEMDNVESSASKLLAELRRNNIMPENI